MVLRVLAGLLLMAACASATINHYGAEVEVDPAGNARASLSLLLNASPGTPVTLRLAPVSALQGPPGAVVVPGGIRFPATARNTSPVEIGFTTTEWTSKQGGLWNFSLPLSSDQTIQRARLRVAFPPGAVLQGFEPAAAITSRGSLRLEWSSGPLPAGASRTFTARYLLEGGGAPFLSAETVGLFAASAVGGFLATRVVRRSRAPPPPPSPGTPAPPLEPTPRQRDLLATLAPREREVMEALLRAGGRVTQADLRTGTGLPKSTLSRTLAALQRRHLVEVRGAGHTNLVLLSELFLKE